MNTTAPEMSELKARMKKTWESGDYGVFSKHLEKGALEFFDRLKIPAGTRLLDIACGAGQLTIPAAKRGIKVTGLDLAANLVEQAKKKAQSEGLQVEIMQGDAEELPFKDASFDITMSLIGSMFAPRPDLVASEMIRVTKVGGKIVMGNWTPDGFVGQMFRLMGKHVATPPSIPSPLLWGNEKVCRQRFGDRVKDLKITRCMYPLEYPFPAKRVVDFFFDHYGPTNRAFASLNEAGKNALHEEMTDLWNQKNLATDQTTRVLAEYIEVLGTRI